ncbi:DUF2927 domain-containing protein [Ruixingdingia sedimenti]|uniref:DUF2927 domain-containing protein n=1 Tax=Ruixingdingia sedimenti TaxID=3073604 RepID=A0ABU1F541_9RHOB|nr:DUF2927 domain-containing protein [Xinfangfangia sp. LG-4]MDR5651564.1 DUF2927 domain-containing protein [Xinfangfangia sp. LG-4]
MTALPAPAATRPAARRWLLPAVCALLLSACAAPPVTEVPQRRQMAMPALPAMKNFAPRPGTPPVRANADIARDILDLFFRMESGREVPRFTRYEAPIRVGLAGQVPPGAEAELSRLLLRLRSEAHIDIARADSAAAANLHVEFLPRARMQAVVPHAACFVVPRVGGWDEFRRRRHGPEVDWTTLESRERITVFVPADVAPQEVRDCLHEELAQALGPLNDLYRLSDSVFNDDNFHTVLTGFDMLVLRAAYDPALRTGMTRAEAAAALPAILRRLNPRGERLPARGADDSPRAWIDAIETALGPRTPAPARRVAAHRALAIAEARGWADNRRAFSHFAVARLSLASEIEMAVLNFAEAARIYAALPDGALHVAHVDMQMAAFALGSGQAEEALVLTGRAIPAVQAAENAALLATLLMIRAEALEMLGHEQEARAVRLDSLGWARYGFGADDTVRNRLSEIAALTPPRAGG